MNTNVVQEVHKVDDVDELAVAATKQLGLLKQEGKWHKVVSFFIIDNVWYNSCRVLLTVHELLIMSTLT